MMMDETALLRSRVRRIADLAAEAQRRPDKAADCLDVIESIARDDILAVSADPSAVIFDAESLARTLHRNGQVLGDDFGCGRGKFENCELLPIHYRDATALLTAAQADAR
jgi:hypothetical protein